MIVLCILSRGRRGQRNVKFDTEDVLLLSAYSDTRASTSKQINVDRKNNEDNKREFFSSHSRYTVDRSSGSIVDSHESGVWVYYLENFIFLSF